MILANAWRPLVVASALSGAACHAAPETTQGAAMSPSALIGTWTRVTSSDCSRQYPATIRFEERGVYFAQPEAPGGFATWDSGSFTVSSASQVAISTANDAIITYQYALGASTITFVDPDGCRFEYRRDGA
jgi:hypothetical protein